MRNRWLFIGLLGVALFGLHAHPPVQITVQVTGQFSDGSMIPLEAAWVYFNDTGVGLQTDASGEAQIADGQGGSVLSVQKPGWIAALKILTGQETEIAVTLSPGDVYPDGIVDVRDVAALVDHLGAVDSPYDFTSDGQVGLEDLEDVARHMGATGTAPSYTLIDDAEDPNPQSQLSQGSHWQVLTDQVSGGGSTSNPPSGVQAQMVAGGVHSSQYAAHYSYTLQSGFAFPFALMRLNTTSNADQGVDWRAFSGLEFWLRGNGVPVAVSLKSGPTDDDFHEYEVIIPATPTEWTRYTFSFEQDFQQPGWGQPESITTVLADLDAVQFKSQTQQVGEQGEIWVDNLMLIHPGTTTTTGALSGRITDHSGAPIRFARVRLPNTVGTPAALTDADGQYEIPTVAVGMQTVHVARAGFATSEQTVSIQVGAATDHSVALNASVPSVKPVSTGPVRIVNRQMETDFDGDGTYDPYQIKGPSFSIAPIGSSGSVSDRRIHTRAMVWLDSLNANTIRNYSTVDPVLLEEMAPTDVKLIASYWVDYALDFSNPHHRHDVLAGFRTLVETYKDHPSVLMWNLGNEQNLDWANGNNEHWYDLVQELALTAYEIEGANYHPVAANNGGVDNIGSAAFLADDASLTYMDLWAANIYGSLQTPLAIVRNLTNKPIVITEFGIDALDNRTLVEYELEQASVDSTRWREIEAAADVCVGGTVFEFTDEWWKAEDPNTHGFGGYATPLHPDGFSNEEWWGLIALSPDADADGLDEWRARRAFFTLRALWGNGSAKRR